MTDHPLDPIPPSQALPPTVLDQAPLVLVVHEDGRASLFVRSTVRETDMARFLRETADVIEAGDHRVACAACQAGEPHPEH